MAPKDKYLCPTFINPPSLADPEFYSHAVSVDGPARLVFTSGQVGGRKDGTFPDSFKEQVEQAFKNLEEVLHASGAQIRDVIKLKWFCVNWKADQSFQDLLKLTFAFLTDQYGVRFQPLTTLVPVPALAFPHIKFEVEATAAIGGSRNHFTPSPNPAELRLPSLKADVVIVGAGFSGLQTAYDLHQAGHKVLVLEAKKRVGGRSWTIPLKSGKGRVELGATWINQKTQRKVYGLAKQFGLDTVEQYAEGLAVYQDTNGHVFRTDATSVPEVRLHYILLFRYVNTYSFRIKLHQRFLARISIFSRCSSRSNCYRRKLISGRQANFQSRSMCLLRLGSNRTSSRHLLPTICELL